MRKLPSKYPPTGSMTVRIQMLKKTETRRKYDLSFPKSEAQLEKTV